MSVENVSTVVDRLARRLRVVRALEDLVRSALVAAGLLCLGLAWDKFRPLPARAWQGLLVAAALVVLVRLATAAVRPVSRLAAARLADVHLDLEDRLSSACEFSTLAHPTPFMLAHIHETASHLHRVVPAEAVPFRVPRGLPLLASAVVVMGVLLMLPGFDGRASAVVEPRPAPLPALRFDGERTVDSLLAGLDLDRDRKLADAMRQLKQLYADIRAGQLSRDEALSRVGEVEARLDDVERRRTAGRTAHTWRRELEKSLAAKGAVLAEHPASADLGRAMADLKLDEASRTSRALAERAAGKPPTLELTPEQSKALAGLMTRAAGTDRRTLDVLSRQMDEAGRQLSLEDLQALARTLGEMAGELDRLNREMEKLKGLGRMDEELEELKDVVSALRLDGTGRWVLGPAGGDGRALGYFKLQGVDPPKGDDEDAQPGVGDTARGPGTGGEPKRIDATRTPRVLPGIWGDGDSLIEVVRGAASEGVAATAYRDVADTAARIAEDAVHAEDIPLDYRFYIKRYFQLIRPPLEPPKETP